MCSGEREVAQSLALPRPYNTRPYLVAQWCFYDTHVQEPIAALLRFAATPGSDNPSSRNHLL
jgi:hypothetical protein